MEKETSAKQKLKKAPRISSGQKVGFLGAGQLACMTTFELYKYGIESKMFSNTPNAPGRKFTPYYLEANWSDDLDKLKDFFKDCFVVTLESEFVPQETLYSLEKAGVRLAPSAAAFESISEKLKEKETFNRLGVPIAPFYKVNEKFVQSLTEGSEKEFNFPCFLKWSKGGYDGHGTTQINSKQELVSEVQKALEAKQECFIEEGISYQAEVSLIVARGWNGEVVHYPMFRTVQENQICHEVRYDQNAEWPTDRALEYAQKFLNDVDYVGVLCFEFFLLENGRLILNETAPRPHNSGHLTQDLFMTSQFELHAQSICGISMNPPIPCVAKGGMKNLLGEGDGEFDGVSNLAKVIERDPDTRNGFFHYYGKDQEKTGRKMGHVNYRSQE